MIETSAVSWFKNMGFKVRVIPAPWRSSLLMVYVDRLGCMASMKVDLQDARSEAEADHIFYSQLDNLKNQVRDALGNAEEPLPPENNNAD